MALEKLAQLQELFTDMEQALIAYSESAEATIDRLGSITVLKYNANIMERE